MAKTRPCTVSDILKGALPFVGNLSSLRGVISWGDREVLDLDAFNSLLIDTLANSPKLRKLLPAEIERINGELLRTIRNDLNAPLTQPRAGRVVKPTIPANPTRDELRQAVAEKRLLTKMDREHRAHGPCGGCSAAH